MSTTAEISSSIINALALTDPELDTTIGTPLRKIIDAVAQQQAQGTIDSFLTSYQYDIDSKSAGALDDFVAIFGMTRLQATNATGVVTFSRATSIAAINSSVIAPGTQVSYLSSPPVYVQTTVTGTLAIGSSSIDVPARAVVAGPAGNVPVGALTTLVSAVNGVSTVNNAAAFTGGTAAETDSQLRARWKSTVFKNLAGTDAMYRGVALQTLANPLDPTSTPVSQVNIIGSTSHNTEQITYSGATNSSLTSSAYNYANTVFLAATATPSTFLIPGVHYTVTVNNGVSPATLTITSIGSALTAGTSYNLEYDYVSIASRNDPFGTRWGQGVVNNRVDVYVNGITSNAIPTQSVIFSSSVLFTNSGTLLNTNFVTPQGTTPSVGDVFVPFAYGPITSLSSTPLTITVSATNYIQGVDFDIVHQNNAFGYTPSSLFGLVWYASALAGKPLANNTVISIAYNYNEVPALVADNLSNWRLLGTDVQIHAGKVKWIKISLAVMYVPNFTQSVVNTAINTALSNLLQNAGFGASLQVSDIVNAVHNVSGVDNVRLLNSSDNAGVYAIQQMNSLGTTVLHTYSSQIGGTGYYFPQDILFNDNDYPVLQSVNIVPKTANNFGVT